MPLSSRVRRNSAAASPRFKPRRFLLNGLLRIGEIASSAVKPQAVSGHSESTPPAITASHTPRRRSERAETSAFALDEHAVDTVYATPSAPVLDAMKRARPPCSNCE